MAEPLTFHGDQSNYYAEDVERLVSFYHAAFGFQESYRTPTEGQPEHVELRLGSYLIGISSLEAGRRIHHLPLEPGKPHGEIVIWASDVDRAHPIVLSKGAICIREPHDFDVNQQLRLRVAWYEDPEGNIVQTVCQRV
jgi:lactoylglutathione lyase